MSQRTPKWIKDRFRDEDSGRNLPYAFLLKAAVFLLALGIVAAVMLPFVRNGFDAGTVKVPLGDGTSVRVPAAAGQVFDPPDISREGYNLSWEQDGQPFFPGETVPDGAVVKPVWTPESYEILLIMPDGGVYGSATAVYDDALSFPVPEGWEGIFDGWYNAAGQRITGSDGKVTQWTHAEIEALYAQFRDYYKVILESGKDKQTSEEKVSPGDSYTPPETLPDGRDVTWYEGDEPYAPGTPINSDLHLRGVTAFTFVLPDTGARPFLWNTALPTDERQRRFRLFEDTKQKNAEGELIPLDQLKQVKAEIAGNPPPPSPPPPAKPQPPETPVPPLTLPPGRVLWGDNTGEETKKSPERWKNDINNYFL